MIPDNTNIASGRAEAGQVAVPRMRQNAMKQGECTRFTTALLIGLRLQMNQAFTI